MYYRRRRRKPAWWNSALVIYWISDTHVLAAADGNPDHPEAIKVGTRYIYTAARKVARFVDKANAAKPDLVVHTGDFIERYSSDADIDLFLEKWNGLDPSIPTLTTIGNHDLAAQGTHDKLAVKMGVDGRTPNAGSKFNHSTTLHNERVSVRIITLDTNMDEGGVHGPSPSGRITEATLHWLRSELMASSESVALVFCHHGPHTYRVNYHDEDSAFAYEQMVKDVRKAKGKSFRLYTLFGHHHTLTPEQYRPTLDALYVPGYRPGAAVEHSAGYFTELRVAPNGSIKLRGMSLR